MKYFGTDGIRGEVGKSLPFERAYQLGFAIQKLYQNKKVMIAYDTRASYLDFTYALLKGLNRTDVEILGMFPTPVLAYESKVKDAIGIMITASHNPYTDNGLKVFEKGLKASSTSLKQLEIFMDDAPFYERSQVHFTETKHIEAYLTFLKSLNFEDNISQNVLFDCANGATSYIAPMLFNGVYIHHEPNGTNINLGCGSTYIERHLDASKSYDLVITFDGDGDRMLAILDGHIIYGDVLLYLFAKDDASNSIKHNVALSIMTNPGILKAFQDLEIEVYETPVGDAYIIDAIEKNQVTRGAEASGHILTEHITIGDGILASCKLFDVVSRQGLEQVKSWLGELQLYPMETKNIHINKNILNQIEIQTKLDIIIQQVPKPGKVIVRPSGTEDVIRITVSLDSQEKVTSQIKVIETLLLGGIQ